MYHGKYSNVPSRGGRRRGLWILLVVLLAALVGGTTLALLFDSSNSVTNTFSAADAPEIKIEETVNGSTKSDVYVDLQSPGYSCFVRAAVVITWKDSSGNVYGEAPVEGVDYSISYGNAWSSKDGFWYYNTATSDKTTNLIDRCTRTGTAPEGYALHVEIIAQAVQADPTTAAQQLWGYVPGGN